MNWDEAQHPYQDNPDLGCEFNNQGMNFSHSAVSLTSDKVLYSASEALVSLLTFQNADKNSTMY